MEVRLFCAIFTLIITFHRLSASKEEIRNCQPAAVIKQAQRRMYFQTKGKASLICGAKGDNPLKYTWLKDGVELDIDAPENKRLKNVGKEGDLEISPAEASDAGVYQCKVQNPCGTSLSHKTILLHAHIDPFPKKEEPLKVRAMLGQHQMLNCTPPKSVPEAMVTWILSKDDSEYEDGMDYLPADMETNEEMFKDVETGRRITMDYTGNLYFVHVLEEDAQNGKRYVCMAANTELRSFNQGEDKIIETFGTATSAPVELQWHSEEKVTALEGMKARFKCIFSGYPYPTVRWNRIDGFPQDEERMKQSVDQHEFVISDVQPEDAGQYECTGQNNVLDGRIIRQKFSLKVESFPRRTKFPTDQNVGVEDDVTFVCDVNAIPRADIQWYINGLPIEKAPPMKNRRVDNINNRLVFTNLSQDDSQVIQCNASNVHGYQWADAYLQVEAMEPMIMTKPTAQKVAEEGDITIPCGVEGKPRPKVRWYKGSQKLQGNRYHIMPNGDLQIKSVNTRDSDNYRCIAENRFGEAEAEGSLVVRRKTEINSWPEDEKVNFGENVIFTCGAVTDDEERERLRYIWLKDGKEVDTTNNPRVRLVKGTLMINATTSRDTGEYTCRATNDLDADEAKATLEVKAPPDAPTNASLTSCRDVSAEVVWEFKSEQSNFSPLKEFIVEFNTLHDETLWQEAERVAANKRFISYQMSPWAAYSFRIRARNLMGVSEPSNPTQPRCRSAEARPYGNPKGVQTIGDKTNYLVIDWEPMPLLEHNSKGFLYEVTWQGKGDSEPHKKNFTSWTDEDRFEVPVDGIYKPYTVMVRAYNSLGEAIKDPVPVKGYSGEAPPSVVPQGFELDPDVNVTSTSAGFRWEPVDTSPKNMNGKFQGYKIRYWKKDQKNDTMHEELIIIPQTRSRRATGGDRKIRGKVSGLPSFSDIEADVVVVNTYFSSDGSNMVNFSTPQGVPTRVDYVLALSRGSEHFLLEWGHPKEENGILTGYELGYQRVVGLSLDDEVMHRDDLPPSQHRANIDGLRPNSLYRIYVAGKTEIGTGAKYYIDVRTADDNSELSLPRIYNISASEYEANITFQLAEEPKGQRSGALFYLEYRKVGDYGWSKDGKNTTDHFSLTLSKLEPATNYEVRVVSSQGKGGDDAKSSKERFHTASIGAKKGSVLSAGWFIGMMVAIAILLLILIIVCIVKRNRGKEYKFPPEKDTTDETPGHFNEMAKSEKNGINTSASFERDPEKVPLEDETDSLEEYGDVDPAKFNEDGSFIGQYGDLKPDAPNPSSVAAIV